MYSGRQKTISLPAGQQIALAFGVALFLLILFLAGQSAFKRAQETAPGFTHGLTHGADREIGGEGNGSGSSENRGIAYRNGGSGIGLPQFTAPVVFPPAQALSGEAAFISPGDKEAAQIALVPLHELLENVRRFDAVIWNAGTSDNAQQTASDAPKGSPPLLLDGLEAQVALISPPSYFPKPLQDDVAQATREIRIYLETVRVAGLGTHKISDQADVQAAAHRHLENGSRLLSHLDALAGGVAPAANGTRINGDLP